MRARRPQLSLLAQALLLLEPLRSGSLLGTLLGQSLCQLLPVQLQPLPRRHCRSAHRLGADAGQSGGGEGTFFHQASTHHVMHPKLTA